MHTFWFYASKKTKMVAFAIFTLISKLHIKLHLTKQFMKALDPISEEFLPQIIRNQSTSGYFHEGLIKTTLASFKIMRCRISFAYSDQLKIIWLPAQKSKDQGERFH